MKNLEILTIFRQNLLQESTGRDITWATETGLPDKEDQMALLGSWPSFQEETTIENMQKSKINYLPTIPKSPKYPLCNTYIIFLVDTMEVLELLYIFVYTDEQTSIR